MLVDGIVKGVGELAKGTFKLVDDLHTSDAEKLEAKAKFQELMNKHEEIMESTIKQQIESREKIIVAEMQQGDEFTKKTHGIETA